MATDDKDDGEEISWQGFNEGIKENIGLIYTVLYLILWVALAEAGYGFEFFIVSLIITLVAMIWQWNTIKTAWQFGFDKGQELKKTKEQRKEEILNDMKEVYNDHHKNNP